MDLWIRSQDKKYLVNVKELSYNEKNKEHSILTYIRDSYRVIGTYKTKERALEVLDEIQKMLQPQTIINYESKLEFHPEYTVQNVVKKIPKTEIIELSTYVYEMPKE